MADRNPNEDNKPSLKNLILKLLPENVLIKLKKLHYAHELDKFTEEDESEIIIIKRLVQPGDYVIDIGANIGWYTKVLSKLVGMSGRVYSIEPIPVTFDILCYCVDKLGLTNVELLNYGISERNGVGTMEIPLYNFGGENYYQAKIADGGINKSLRTFQISLRSLDSLFSNLLNAISFIKCDVEGHELSVIMGAKKVIAKFKPACFIEITGDPDEKDSAAYNLFNYLSREGYTPWRFDDKVLVRRLPHDTSVNYFFLQDNHLKRLRNKSLQVNSTL